ncbi:MULTISPECIES: hypothetical protein, partial [unclassified Microcoleus]|uniref:hypothetical protein n=1 Tax=unclassified Microcoleus TaxID=2642155 RepID=UPI002FD48963
PALSGRAGWAHPTRTSRIVSYLILIPYRLLYAIAKTSQIGSINSTNPVFQENRVFESKEF